MSRPVQRLLVDAFLVCGIPTDTTFTNTLISCLFRKDIFGGFYVDQVDLMTLRIQIVIDTKNLDKN